MKCNQTWTNLLKLPACRLTFWMHSTSDLKHSPSVAALTFWVWNLEEGAVTVAAEAVDEVGAVETDAAASENGSVAVEIAVQ